MRFYVSHVSLPRTMNLVLVEATSVLRYPTGINFHGYTWACGAFHNENKMQIL
jgi:hypothetical protein